MPGSNQTPVAAAIVAGVSVSVACHLTRLDAGNSSSAASTSRWVRNARSRSPTAMIGIYSVRWYERKQRVANAPVSAVKQPSNTR